MHFNSDFILRCYENANNEYFRDFSQYIDAESDILSEVLGFFGTRLIKVALIGSSGVGKTTFLKKIKSNRFEPCYYPTSSVESDRIFRNGTTFEFIDFSGQEMYYHMNRELHGIDIIVCIVDSSRLSYKNAILWHDRINRLFIPRIFVRNKSEIISNYTPENSRITHFMSAKTGEGVEELLEKIESSA
jgi:small GTP-binding protein